MWVYNYNLEVKEARAASRRSLVESGEGWFFVAGYEQQVHKGWNTKRATSELKNYRSGYSR